MDKKAANRQSKADSYAQKYGKRSQVLDTKARIAKEEADKVRSVKQKKVADKQVENKNHLTDEQKRMIRNGAIAAGAALAVVGGMYLYKKGKLNPTHIAFFRYGKNMDLSNLSNEAFVISKTHKLQRVTNNSIEDYIGEGKSIYASFTKKDNHLYKEIMPKYINEWDAQGIIKGGNSAYVHSMKLKRDIKIAPDKVWVDAYMKVNDVDHVDLGEARKFMVNLVDRNNEINKSFFKEISSKGYDGMFDLNDMGASFAQSPIILFNPSEVIESSKSHKLTKISKFINVMTS